MCISVFHSKSQKVHLLDYCLKIHLPEYVKIKNISFNVIFSNINNNLARTKGCFTISTKTIFIIIYSYSSKITKNTGIEIFPEASIPTLFSSTVKPNPVKLTLPSETIISFPKN